MIRSADHCTDKEAGFGLIETIISAAIIAMMLTAFFQTISANAKATQQVLIKRQATMLAQSALAVASGSGANTPESYSGSSGTLTWTISISPYDDNARSSGPALELVTVRVRDATTQRIVSQLQTLRLQR